MLRRLPLLLTVAVLAAAGYYVLVLRAPVPKSAPVATAPAPAPAPTTPERVTSAPAPTAPEAPATTTTARRRVAPAPTAAAAPAEAAPTVGVLHIDSDVQGAQVFVDREFVGAAPATKDDVKPGSHVINVTAPGFEGVSTTIDVEPGARDLMVKLREVRLKVSAQVVHKHRIGSCTGTLTATPQGLRYETTDKEDAFSAPLIDLETFEVDYVAKNLRIKPAKGKRYDFTDPQGNADKLFVFHRDVDKARQRLKKGDPPATE
jgi:hypothetical protein